MVTFTPTIAPSYNSNKNKDFRILSAEFGDGYAQRAADGLNYISENWQLSWSLLTEAQADEITDFFDARAGIDAFTWTTPDGDSKNFLVSEYTRVPIANDIYSVSATLDEDFNN